jgi:hypothetical protein
VNTALATREPANLDILEKLIVDGDLSKLSQEERLRYYHLTCERLDLDPMSQPLSYLKLNNKLVLYAGRGATDQIARKAGISRRIVRTEILTGKVYLVVAEATDASGRVEQSTGAVNIENLFGENLVNALLRAETKAKRRAVLSFTGAGMLDETEVETIPGARPIAPTVTTTTGEVTDPPADAKTLARLRHGKEALACVGFQALLPKNPTQSEAEKILANWAAEYKRREAQLDAAFPQALADETADAEDESPL